MGHLLHFIVGFAVLLHVLFWGAGAALLIVPRPWRRFWPALIVVMGLALQSAVVWAGAHTEWAGTQRYAWASEIAPVLLLWLGLARHGWRAAWTDVSRFGLVGLLLAGVLGLLILPLAIASNGLTTLSLGSCDAADYAAGARVLQEFAATERGGFLGLTEVVRVHSVDNFFDYWIRLNHFTPAALIAFNGTVVDCAPHEVTSLMTMVLLAGSLPLVFWVSRAILGYSGGVSLGIALLYGISPITWYAVAHVAMGQLLAAQAIALLTWAGVALWRGRVTWRRAGQFLGVMTAGYWLVLGSYNFILLVALVPAVAYAGGLALWRREWRRFFRWFTMMVAPLVLASALFFERVAGLAERFSLLRDYDFGWRIPALTWEGWLGMVSGPGLAAWDFWGVRWLLAVVVGVAFVWALWRVVRQGRPGGWLVTSLIVPVLAGYFFLQIRGARLGTNASYDAYKLFAVFYPLLLPALCWWVTLRRSRRISEWFGVVGIAGLVVAANFVGTGMFIYHLARTPLMVDGALRQLRRVEAMPEVTSINMLLPNMWERLWANALLLRKPQYFLTDSYEARWATRLRGEWNLESNLITVAPADGIADSRLPHHRLLRKEAADPLRAEFGEGWHDEERLGGERWRWSRATGILRFENRRARAVSITITLEARSLENRDVEVRVGGAEPQVIRVRVERSKQAIGPLEIAPGQTEMSFRPLQPTATTAAGDERVLGICVHRLNVHVRD